MKSKSAKFAGHIFALLTSLFWGTTFIATDYLLESFTTLQLLSMRFLIGYLILVFIKPKPHIQKLKTEAGFLLMSLTGVLGYYYLENLAVFHNGANNTSILIGCIPLVTVILMCLTGKMTRVTFAHIIGFLLAISGIVLVVYNGAVIETDLNGAGTTAAIGACFCWGVYSMLAHTNISAHPITMARRTLFWSMLITVILTLFTDGMPSFAPLKTWEGAVSLAVLGLFGSGLCYYMWNRAIALIGVDIATNYIYAQPFITMGASAILGTETISVMGFVGAGLILVGVVISDLARPDKKKKKHKAQKQAPDEEKTNKKPKKEKKASKKQAKAQSAAQNEAQSRYALAEQNRANAKMKQTAAQKK